MLYQDAKYVIEPTSAAKVIFACDPVYWQKYGRYLAKSCDNLLQDIHIHLLDSDQKNIECVTSFIETLNIESSLSYEHIPKNLLEPQKISYFYTARYFCARDIFKNFTVKEAVIVDCDLIFKNKFQIPDGKDLGFCYKPDPNSLFHSVQGNLFFIKENKSWFLDKIIESYKERFDTTDWNFVTNYKKNDTYIQNFYGLDQVCIAMNAKLVVDDPGYLNIGKNFIDKKEFGKKPIWTLTGNKNESIENRLKEKFGF